MIFVIYIQNEKNVWALNKKKIKKLQLKTGANKIIRIIGTIWVEFCELPHFLTDNIISKCSAYYHC